VAAVRRKLIVVSNRGPVTFATDGSARRSSGGWRLHYAACSNVTM
jgi:hypothetical protein